MIALKRYVGSCLPTILNFDLIKFSKNIEHDLSSTINFLPLSLNISFGNLFISKSWFDLIILFLINFVHFSFLLINKIFFVLLIINLELGIGLLGPSPPLIFNNHATFSGAVIKI